MEIVLSINLIASNPQVRDGRPCLAGTGLRVSDIAIAHLFHNQSPDELAVACGVSLAGVHAAMANYYEHKVAIDEDIRQQLAKARKLKQDWLAEGGNSLLSR